MGTVILRPGHVQPVHAGHPWVYAQAVARVDGAPGAGDPVRVLDPHGNYLGSGFWSPKSAIPVRIVTRAPEERLDEAAILRRIERGANFRRAALDLPSSATDGYRLINAEGDDLPGLVVDVYGSVAVAQFRTAGMKRREEIIAAEIRRVSGAQTVIAAAAKVPAEGLADEERVLRGDPPDALIFRERGLEWRIPRSVTQKTGYYFDQRDNRASLEKWASGRVLDVYSFVGGMGLAAARGRADEVTCIDSSALAIATGAAVAEHNGLAAKVRFEKFDAKRRLPELVARGDRYDVVVLDPPKLAPTRKHFDSARRAYVQLNRLGAQLVARGGLLVTCSCSAAMRPSDFVRAVNEGVRAARRDAILVALGGQAPDHATPLAFSEGRYLKTLFLRVE
ncbi:MAG: class I SAM-dependent rRNA methyltransferase [Myxococcales bacterium]|nr:class I SAM-dependent rRNA methyltransferase [Myxococcales bacterium]